jgi:hypothetical protein
MPISKRRKKKGKPVGKGTRITVDPEKESSVTLQDLINALAWQESQKPDDDPTKLVGPSMEELVRGQVEANGDILADDAVINVPDSVPVYVGEGENRVQIGTAQPKAGSEATDITITDPEVMAKVQNPDNYSVGKGSDG